MVPKGWELSSIGKISDVSSGGTPSRNNEAYWNGNIPWVTTAEVQFKIIEDTVEKITEEGLANSSAKLFPAGTILMAMYGQGKTRGQVAKLGIDASTNQACAAIVLHTGYEVDFYYQFLISQYENIREMANSGGQQNLSGGIVKSIPVPVPPLTEQKKIAKILSTWDNAISVTEKLLTNSQQQKKALMQQLLTGKKRLLDENGVRFSGEWRNSTLSMFCNIAKGKALSASDLEVGDFPVIAGGKSSPYSHSDYTHENVVTVSASGAYAGYISYHNYKIWASDCSVVSAKADNLIDYFYQLLLSLQDKIYSLQSGGAQPHIYPKDLNSIPLWVPCVKEQQKIAAVLSAADAEISTLEKKLACLRDEKKALMQQLLTGKRRVKVDEAVAE
ncbi:TPA: restriction endonuclease subunit S [Escherichia coli]|uniref:restriction endonuclease subunit S n=1 Tax=Escherichia coli TaxID=562 RepID=UPI0017D5D088|nr:restriction endonuclease subunit S [Escherichia coli]EFL0086101.1 restriction endonuclease subunit S [Escherichia coli]HAL6757643.1 restriction endonuclease subunit S [Escherichia coli]HAN5980348.1 restriction endonuclease subunit S [Escherichia coli]